MSIRALNPLAAATRQPLSLDDAARREIGAPKLRDQDADFAHTLGKKRRKASAAGAAREDVNAGRSEAGAEQRGVDAKTPSGASGGSAQSRVGQKTAGEVSADGGVSGGSWEGEGERAEGVQSAPGEVSAAEQIQDAAERERTGAEKLERVSADLLKGETSAKWDLVPIELRPAGVAGGGRGKGPVLVDQAAEQTRGLSREQRSGELGVVETGAERGLRLAASERASNAAAGHVISSVPGEAGREPEKPQVGAGLANDASRTATRTANADNAHVAPANAERVPPAWHAGAERALGSLVNAGRAHEKSSKSADGRVSATTADSGVREALPAGAVRLLDRLAPAESRRSKEPAQSEQASAEQRAQVIAQVERGLAAAVTERSQTVTLRLQPATLGQVRVQVRIDEQGRVSARFEVSSGRTRDILSGASDSLRGGLEGRGLTLGAIDVVLSEAQTPGITGTDASVGSGRRESAETAEAVESAGAEIALDGFGGAIGVDREGRLVVNAMA